tara:strand:+ start:158 stop:445 length:288 start_codon:yes stop_codon:yes gene_type:complete
MPSFLMPCTHLHKKWRHLAPKQAAGHVPNPVRPPLILVEPENNALSHALETQIGRFEVSTRLKDPQTSAKTCKKRAKKCKKRAKACKPVQVRFKT